jgi:undecaprenyl phosphate-alpha-L-ara4FN deformylase
MKIALRVDVDTFRGTKLGVPNLCNVLADHSIKATFFFSVGPDNMGRHLWRLLKPAFLRKMLRTRAASLYGWDILFRGTFWPGPVIGRRLAPVIRAAVDAGHECGLHAWDHHAWQARIERMDGQSVRAELEKGFEMLSKITGRPPVCSASPGWKCNDIVLKEKLGFPFVYNSDCRGEGVFRPLVDGEALQQPQIPVSLPTYDEVVGRNGISDENYNDHVLSLARADAANVLTIHAECEGIVCAGMFNDFLKTAEKTGISFVSLGQLLTEKPQIARAAMTQREIPGREGWVACREDRLAAGSGRGEQEK